MEWQPRLPSMTESVDPERLLCREYLVTEDRILRKQIEGRVRFSDGGRKAPAGLGQRLDQNALEGVASLVKLDTMLA